MSIEKALEVFGIVDKVLIDEIISVVCLVLLLVPQVLQLDCIDQVKDLSTVSGFYGPGAYIAWILTFTSTLTSYEMNLSVLKPFRWIFQWHRRPEIGGAVDIQPSPIDSNFIASVAFPLIACVDCFKRIITGVFDGQLDAAACVVHTSVLFTFVAFRGSLFQYRVRKLGNYNFTRLARFRLLALSTLWFICIITPNPSRMNPYTHIQMLFAQIVTMATMTMICELRFLYHYALAGAPFVLVWLSIHPLNDLRDFFSGQLRPCVLRVRFPFPQTASKLGDLDQAAALATGLAIFMYPILEAATRTIWRLLGTPQDPPNTNQSTLPH